MAVNAQESLIHNVNNRLTTSLNGQWKYIIDPYETGYRFHRNWIPYDEDPKTTASAKNYFSNAKAVNSWDRVEYDFDKSDVIKVPSDWNSQKTALLYYEGTVWYKNSFDYKLNKNKRLFLYFGSANYESDIYLNGKKLGKHKGGFDPFNYEITDLVKNTDNFLIVRVNNQRKKENVPNLATDWWNYGGLTGDVKLIELPETHIRDYHIQLDKNNSEIIKGYVQLNGKQLSQKVMIEILGTKTKKAMITDSTGNATFSIKAKKIIKWYPKRPKLYKVLLRCETDIITDQIGFRTIKVKDIEIVLNDKPIFLRGISLHGEIPQRKGRANSYEDAKYLLGQAKELNCNFVRLAHYPHTEYMPRLADEMGLLLWEEIPVYWGIDYKNTETYQQAENQLKTLINRDKNRASVIIWSLANETPVNEERNTFLKKLKRAALELDTNRLISAALEREESKEKKEITINDPFAQEVDIVSCNEYLGWYGSLPSYCSSVSWNIPLNKPFFISEFGGGALYGYHGDSLTIWTEEYQEYLYKEQLKMLKKIPALRGMTPWILFDFRSPRRNLPDIQDGWNRKGLISNEGKKKKAFYILKDYYKEIEKKYHYDIN
jgi:beta-glucuronidase